MNKNNSETVVINPIYLQKVIFNIFSALGVSAKDCELLAGILLEASLSGYNSHGVMRIPVFVEGIQNGTIVPDAEIKILHESLATASIDANFALGPVSTVHAVRMAVGKARATGLGAVTVVNGNDIARLGSYMAGPVADGFIVMMMTNDAGGNPAVVPWGGVEPLLSTNPLAVGIPRKDEPPIIIDMSTAIVAEGKIKMRHKLGQDIPEGWLINNAGETETDPEAYLSTPRRAGLLPLGGMMSGHKGFALSLMVESLAGALSGAGCSTGEVRETDRNGLFVLAIDPEKFCSRDSFVKEMEVFAQRLKQVRTMPGVEQVSIPGERAARQQDIHRNEGMQVDAITWARIQEIMQTLGIKETA